MNTNIDISTLYESYWRKLTNELIDNYPEFKPKKADRNAYYLPLGSKYAHISMKVNSVKKIEECKIVISHNKGLFDILEKIRDEIEDELGFDLDWERKDGVESHITCQRNFNIRNEDEWDDAITWHLTTASKFYDTFSIRIG